MRVVMRIALTGTEKMGCSDIFLIIVQVIAILVDCFAIAGLIWQLTLGAVWNLWILSIYVVFFCLFQLMLEIFLPRLVWVVFNVVTRFWGFGLLYVLTGIICVAVGNPSTSAPSASVMCFAAGVVMFGIGVLYILLSIVSCCKCHPIPCCSRCGHGAKYEGEDVVYHEYK